MMSSTASYDVDNLNTTLKDVPVVDNLGLPFHPLIFSFVIMVICLSALFISCGIYLRMHPQQGEKEITKPEKPGKAKRKKHLKKQFPESYTLHYENPAMKQSPKQTRDLVKCDIEMKVVEVEQHRDVIRDDSVEHRTDDLPRYNQLESKI